MRQQNTLQYETGSQAGLFGKVNKSINLKKRDEVSQTDIGRKKAGILLNR